MLIKEKTSIYLAVELSVKEVSWWCVCEGADDATIVLSRDAQSNFEKSPTCVINRIEQTKLEKPYSFVSRK